MNISKISNCYGCMACIDVCPKQCITIKKGKLDHIFPSIINKRCTDCGKCLTVCPSENPPNLLQPSSVYAAWGKNENTRIKSSSGGLASILSENIIRENGVVYGCTFLPKFIFKHIRCTSLTQLQSLRGSKYVQSDMRGIYTKIKQDLKDQKKVLFIGTPCQVAGVKLFFKNKSTNLYTIDLICHGVPSVNILKKSLPHKLWKYDFNEIEFRTCTKFHFSVKNNISTVFDRPLHKDLFLKGFFTALFYRDSCYSCQYARTQRIGDITLGDFWGINANEIETDIEKGVSLCMVNTLKGKDLLNSIHNYIYRVSRPIEEAVAGNKQLKHPTPRSLRTKYFSIFYPIVGFKWAVYLSIPEIIIKNLITTLYYSLKKIT